MIGSEDALLRRTLKRLVVRQGFDVIESSGSDDLMGSFKSRKPDLIIIISSWQDTGDTLTVARQIRQQDQGIPLILIASRSSEELAIKALRIGVSDYLKLPVLPEDLMASIRRSLASPDLEPGSKSGASTWKLSGEGQMVGRGQAMSGVKKLFQEVASTDSTVLITGETGTGKDLAASLIHRYSRRSKHPFVVINCAAIPETLLESELFGYEKGAFTGAYSKRDGALQMAQGGTAFFDEIGDMNPYAQAKLLRIMENREICPIGGNRRIPLNVKIIAATNQDLEQLMKAGKFRADLYFRINVARVHLPPLRERKEDIVPLLEYFRQRLNHQFGKEVEGFSEAAVAALMDYDWPGNIRELKNFLEATFISAPRQVDLQDIPVHLRQRLQISPDLSQNERNRLLTALFNTSWNKTKAAQQLQWSRMTLYRKMLKHKIISPLAGNDLPYLPSYDTGDGRV